MAHAAMPLERGPQRVHFAPDQAEGSHRHPEEFRTGKTYTVRTDADLPFDVWYHDWKLYNGELKSTSDLWKARFTAVVPLFKGLAFTIVELVKTLYHKIVGTKLCATCKNALSRQWKGVTLSAEAIYSPNDARRSYVTYWRNYHGIQA